MSSRSDDHQNSGGTPRSLRLAWQFRQGHALRKASGTCHPIACCLQLIATLILCLCFSAAAIADDHWIGRGGAKIRTWPEILFSESNDRVVPAKAEAPEEAASDQSAPQELPPSPSLTQPSIALEPTDGSAASVDETESIGLHHARSQRFQLFELPRDRNNFGMFGFQFDSLLADDSIQTLSTPVMHTGWGITWLDGPAAPDLPGQLYNVNFDLGFSAKIGDRWLTELAVTPGWWTDWKNLRPESFRLQGRAVSYYRYDDAWTLVGGFVYLNRDDIPALPVVGAIWDQSDDGLVCEFVFPVPKVSYKVLERVDSSVWLYAGGELGGGSYAIKRQDRTPDVITYRDYRAVIGLNHARVKASQHSLEAGWVFGRRLDSRLGRWDYSLADTLMVRWLVDY